MHQLYAKNEKHHKTFVEPHVADQKITEAIIRSLFCNNGLLKEYRCSLMPLYGVLHSTLSLVKNTVSVYSILLFKPWRIVKKVDIHGKPDTPDTYNSMLLRVSFRQLGVQLAEINEISEAWIRIRHEFPVVNNDNNNLLLKLLRPILDNHLPLCVSFMRAAKAGKLNALIDIFERMAGIYLWLPNHSVYRRATLFMASNLRRWSTFGENFVKKFEEMVVHTSLLKQTNNFTYIILVTKVYG